MPAELEQPVQRTKNGFKISQANISFEARSLNIAGFFTFDDSTREPFNVNLVDSTEETEDENGQILIIHHNTLTDFYSTWTSHKQLYDKVAEVLNLQVTYNAFGEPQ